MYWSVRPAASPMKTSSPMPMIIALCKWRQRGMVLQLYVFAVISHYSNIHRPSTPCNAYFR